MNYVLEEYSGSCTQMDFKGVKVKFREAMSNSNNLSKGG